MKINPWARLSALAVAVTLAACGGSEDGNQTPRASYGKLVSFGDSLSDVGTYRVGVVAAMGGGRYTVNAGGGENWTELLAAQLGVEAPCAAQTGLNSAAALGGPVAVEDHAGCYGYAQGGARVTEAVGPGNAALLALGDSSGALGQLTDPVVNQITRHLAAAGGRFAADDLVTVMAGGNDLFMNLASLQAQVEAGADATTAATAAVTAMGVAGAELAGYVKAMILAKGAERVVVVNLPDVSLTPMGAALNDSSRTLVRTMAAAFNAQLATGLGSASGVLSVDAFTTSQTQQADPAQFGVSNATTPACDLSGALASLPTSLVCTAATTVVADTSRYYFADKVHPTPYGYKLLTQLVTDALLKAGWL